jgi:glycosyltransferase involved in cell wall biosynthesis
MQISRSGNVIEFSVNNEAISKIKEYKSQLGEDFPKFGIFILTYNHSNQIENTLSRIPDEIIPYLGEIFLFDDCSPDNTIEVVKDIPSEERWNGKLSVYQNQKNQGYGGNQKVGYRYGIEKGMDYTIMLHGDGQYAPEYIPDFLIQALETKKDAIFASRMLDKKAALKGGMPLFKFVGNQLISAFQNFILGTKISEFHSGYRMYSTNILNIIPFEVNTNDMHFDTEALIQCRAIGTEVIEFPIKAFYGDEEHNVPLFTYLFNVCAAVLIYRLHQLHIIRESKFIFNREVVYTKKRSPYSSHEIILKKISKGHRVLDIEPKEKILFKMLKDKCDDVVHLSNPEEIWERNFFREFDYIILSDVLPMIREDQDYLIKLKKLLKSDGKIIASVPNIAIWVYRISLAIGRFNYAGKGPLDRRNIRFYTKFSILRLFDKAQFNVLNLKPSGLPFEVVFESSGRSNLLFFIDWAYYLIASIWHKLFAYQFVVEAEIASINPEIGEGKISN